MRSRIVCISDVLTSQRLDVAYHNDDQFLHGFVSLSNYVSINGGKRLPKGETFSSEKTSYLYLRLADIVDLDNIDYTKLPSISETIFNTLKRYEIVEGEVSISIAGTIGKVFITKNIPIGERVILTENCAIIRPKVQSLSPVFLKLLLNCTFVQQQIKRNSIQTTIPKIGLDRIGKLRIPVIPPIHIQENIIEIYTKAQEAKQAKDKEAKSLLDSIDDYLIEKLHLDDIIKERQETLCLMSNLSSLIGGRLDPHQFHTERIETIESIKKGEWCSLKEVVNEIRTTSSQLNSTYIGMENINGNTGDYLPIKENMSICSSTVIFSKGNILFPKLRPYLNKVHRAQFSGCCSTEFHVFEAHDINPDFLTIILRSSFVLAQTKHLMTGNTLPRLQTTDINNLIIPYPEVETQEEIVNIVHGIRNKVNRLQEEGTVMLEKAKQEIEKLILGL